MSIKETIAAAIAEMRDVGREVANTTEELLSHLAEELDALKGAQTPPASEPAPAQVVVDPAPQAAQEPVSGVSSTDPSPAAQTAS